MQEGNPGSVTEEVESLTIHGISRVVSARSEITRIIWLLLCICAFSCLSRMVSISLIRYFSFQSTVNISVNNTYQHPLPAITFCHTNYYKLQHFDDEAPPVVEKFPNQCIYESARNFSTKQNKFSFDLGCRMFFGAVTKKTCSINQLQSCRFPVDFTFVPNFYPCFTLNRNSSLIQRATGEDNGLHLLLYSEELQDKSYYGYEAYDFLNDKRRGIKVWMHDQKQQIPFDDGVILPSGFHTHISIRKNVIKRLMHPYPSKCSEEEFNQDSIYPGKNTQNMCYISCFYKEMYKMCPGISPDMKVFMKAPNYQNATRAKDYWQCFSKKRDNVDYTKCNCKPHCHEEIYRFTASRSTWPQKWEAASLARFLNNVEGKNDRNLSVQDIREKLIKVSIYYENFQQTIYEETPLYELVSIASDLGGQMGLFFGASLLSIAEIFSIVIQLIKRRICMGNSATKPSQ